MADQRKADLIRQLDRARSQAAANSRALQDDLQVGDRLKENIERNRGAWISGAVLTGLVISKIPPRTKSVIVAPKSGQKAEETAAKAGFLGLAIAAAKVIFNFARPFLMKWVTRRLSQSGYIGVDPYRRTRA